MSSESLRKKISLNRILQLTFFKYRKSSVVNITKDNFFHLFNENVLAI